MKKSNLLVDSLKWISKAQMISGATAQGVANDTLNYYGLDGTKASNGPQSNTFFYDRRGIEVATAKKVYAQFADSRSMPLKHGKEYRVKVWHHAYERLPYTDATMGTIGGDKAYTSEFARLGYITGRDVADVTNGIYGSDGKGYATNGLGTDAFQNNGARLLEGEGPTNKITLTSTVYNAKFEKFGKMLDYTEEVELFSEDFMQVRYREELGEDANRLYEDLLQLEMLATPTVMYAGTATSMATLGVGIGKGDPDVVTQRNQVEEDYKVNYSLIQKITQKLYRNRVPKHTELLKGSVNIGTTPIGACYVAIIPPEVKIDLENMVRGATYEKKFAFTPVEQYASQGALLEGEVGRVGEIRFIVSETALIERGRGAVVDNNYIGQLSWSEVNGEKRFDVFPILIPGKGSFATIGLVGHDKIKFYAKTPSDIEKTDPFGSNGFFSYKFWHSSILTRPERMLRVNVLASA